MYYNNTFVIFVLLLQLLMSFKVVLTLEKCSELLPQPTNGRIEYRISKENKTIAILSCNDGYRSDGNVYIECDGKWNNQIGTCKESTNSIFKIDEKEHIPTSYNKDAILRALDNSSDSLDSEDDAEIDEDYSNDSDVSNDNNIVANTTISTPTTIVNNNGTMTTGNSTNNSVNTTISTPTGSSSTNSSISTTISTPTTIANNGTTFTTMTSDTTTDSSTTSDIESSTTITSDSSTITSDSTTISTSSTIDSAAATGSSTSTNNPGNTANNNDTVNSTVKPFPNAGIRNYVSYISTILIGLEVSILFIHF